MWLRMADRYQEAQRRLNLVKTHAHEIVGVKREQVHRVVENLGSPGTYDITVHENGRVYTQKWTAPEFGDAFVPVAGEEYSPLVLPPETVVEVDGETIPLTGTGEVPEGAAEGLRVVSGDSEVVSESNADAEVPVPVRGRGRPKKVN